MLVLECVGVCAHADVYMINCECMFVCMGLCERVCFCTCVCL